MDDYKKLSKNELAERMRQGHAIARSVSSIEADTPEETKREIVKWLEDQGLAHRRAARIATHKRVMAEETTKADAYRFAAEYVGKMAIRSK